MKSFRALSDQDRQGFNESTQPRYLFVDDDVFILHLLKSFFEKEAEVSIANDGREALEKITGQCFDVIISDVDMPALNGIALFKSLHAKDASIGKRFLFCSGSRSLELEELCSKYQIRFLSKPVCLASLQAELEELGNNLMGRG